MIDLIFFGSYKRLTTNLYPFIHSKGEKPWVFIFFDWWLLDFLHYPPSSYCFLLPPPKRHFDCRRWIPKDIQLRPMDVSLPENAILGLSQSGRIILKWPNKFMRPVKDSEIPMVASYAMVAIRQKKKMSKKPTAARLREVSWTLLCYIQLRSG